MNKKKTMKSHIRTNLFFLSSFFLLLSSLKVYSYPYQKKHYLFLNSNQIFNLAYHSTHEKNNTEGYGFGYRYFTEDGWITALSTQFKKFQRKEDPFFDGHLCLQEEISMLNLIYYPLIASTGFKLSYLYPIEQKDTWQIKRNKTYAIEIGGALVFSLYYSFSKKILMSLSIERWRGFNTSYFQGIELGLNIHYKFSS